MKNPYDQPHTRTPLDLLQDTRARFSNIDWLLNPKNHRDPLPPEKKAEYTASLKELEALHDLAWKDLHGETWDETISRIKREWPKAKTIADRRHGIEMLTEVFKLAKPGPFGELGRAIIWNATGTVTPLPHLPSREEAMKSIDNLVAPLAAEWFKINRTKKEIHLSA